METSLSVESRQKFDTNLKNLLNPLANLFSKKNLKINGESVRAGRPWLAGLDYNKCSR